MNGVDLPGLFFLDTNIFVYSFDATAPHKQQVARDLIQHALRTQNGVISTQVIQEFLNVALRKFAKPMTIPAAQEYLKLVLTPLCQHYPSLAFYDHALRVRDQTGFSFFDALILTAAGEVGCMMLLSEDMQAGRTVEGVTILNPFTSAALMQTPE